MKMPAFEWVHVQLHQQKGMISLSPPTICNSAVLAKVADHHGDVIVALGREGREDAKVNAKTHPHTAAIAAKLKTEQGDAAYRRRKSIVEAPNGWIKAVMGLRQFSMRGLDKVQAEWKLVCMALNLRRMAYL
ncbi:transposase (plasmid) [Klebsiella pneumoniae]|nr:transposase [Klebsiella pneumoniae]